MAGRAEHEARSHRLASGVAASHTLAMSRLEPECLYEPFRRAPESVRPCNMPGCQAEGVHRAPVSRDRLADYFWFCLDHVREYNRAWDYFRGMSESEIEAIRRFDTVWHRPSWPLAGRYGAGGFEARIEDPLGLFGEQEARSTGTETRLGDQQRRALALLELSPPVAFVEIKAQYKVLVKRHHPDANGGDKAAEERLKLINQAYATLKAAYA
jgi:curved DNA-binding protein CbpA